MDTHRLVKANRIATIPLDPPFSSFDYVDATYGRGDNHAIRRLFSLARSREAHTLLAEEIDAAGIIADENDEIKQYVVDHQMEGLHRISFWQSRFDAPEASTCSEEHCIGYAILKRDTAPSLVYDRWHVFEAIFNKYPDRHNCVPNPVRCTLALGGERSCVEGVLYAQQNELNKRCGQVALRSLISRANSKDVSYRQINDLARQESPQDFNPAKPLTALQIAAVLKGFGIEYVEFDYTQHSDDDRENHPYQKFVYAGIESGMGALVGFHLTGPAAPGMGHIIPFYGHTFNKDTWAPEADPTYFRVGEDVRYVPSESWTSSFLGHDDNFGPNFCVPRLYIDRKKVDYVVELLKPGVMFSGAQAEALALQFLYSVLRAIDTSGNAWLNRLAYYAHSNVQRVVLRAIAIDRETYMRHIAAERDWSQNSEDQQAIKVLQRGGLLPDALWVVEVSVPQLFAANERKLGDIVLNGGIELSADQTGNASFLFARLPGLYFFHRSDGHEDDFLVAPSSLTSHVDLIRLH